MLTALIGINGLALQCRQKNQKENENRITTIENPPAEAMLKESFDLQGHRGCRGLMPENSIPAFLKALELGVTTLELDVVVSKDKKIVISHEPYLSADICLDMKGDSIDPKKEKEFNLYQMTVEEIQKCDCGSLANPKYPKQKKMKVVKPTLKEAIEAVEKEITAKKLKKVRYNIETKSLPIGDSIYHPKPDEFAALLFGEVKKLNLRERVTIQSFDVRTLQAYKKMDEETPLVLLVESAPDYHAKIKELGFTPSVLSPHFMLLTKEIVNEAHEQGMKVIPWTVNEISDIKRVIRLGVDGLITDYPNRYKQLMDKEKYEE